MESSNDDRSGNSSLGAQRITLVEVRPQFEAALARLNEAGEEKFERLRKDIPESFGTWREWD